MDETVSFTRMDEGTAEDFRIVDRMYERHRGGLADEVLVLLKRLGGGHVGYKVDRLEHSLQTATRAMRDGADEETVAVALLHDIGDILAPNNHAEMAAAVLRPYVSADNYWLVKHHALFQGRYYAHHFGGDRDAREKHRGHPMFERTAAFCERWDQVSFDPDYDAAPLATFEPIVRRLFARPANQRGEHD